MRSRLAVVLLMVVVAAGALGSAVSAAGRLPARDPSYDVSRHLLAAALSCPSEFLHHRREPVLLVHGTGLTPAESWAWNYEKLLPAAGFDVCTVALPDRAMTDIQRSAEYVAFAVQTIKRLTHRRVAVITHSQGGMEARWAVRWWPSVRRGVDDLVLLASPNHGIVGADACADSGNCWPAVWQMATAAHFLHALNSVDETPGGVSVTNIYSLSDELVEPSSTVPLRGDHVTNVAVQDLCPRPVHHAGMLTDPAVWALVVDALRHAGPANPAHVSPAVCLQPYAPGLTAADVAGGNAILYADAATQGFAPAPGVPAEPRLAAYARAYG
jgi:triacylglycerol lipase